MVALHKLPFRLSSGRGFGVLPVLVAGCALSLIALDCRAQELRRPNVEQQRVFAPEGLVRLTHFRSTFANRGVFFGGGPKSLHHSPPKLVESPQVRQEVAKLTGDIEADPQNTQLMLRLAEIKTEIGQRQEAIVLLHRVQELEKNSIKAHALLCKAWLGMGDADRAYRHAEEAIELDPKDASGYVARALSRYYLGLIDLALVDIDQAIALDPKDAETYALKALYVTLKGQLEFAERTCDQGLAVDPDNRWALAMRSDLYFRDQNPSEAYRLSKRAIELYPDDMSSLSVQIAVCFQLNRLTEALDHCDHILEGDPGNAYTRRLRAILNSQLKNIDQVEDDCQKLLRLDGDSIESALSILEAYILIDDMQKAKAAHQHAAAIAAEIHNPMFNEQLQQLTAELQKKLRFLE